jgi:hypothetical protein
LPALCAAASPPAPVAVPAASTPTETAAAQKDKLVQMDKRAPSTAPDPALLDYIGRYADAAIGLDPLGLAVEDGAAAPDKERR